MKKHLLIIALLCGTALADLPSDPDEYSAWEIKLIEWAEQIAANPSPDDVPKLGKVVWQLAMPHNREKTEDRPVFKLTQKTLLSIPGHAEYYADRIKDLRDQLDVAGNNIVENSEANRLVHALLPEQELGFQTLQQLPSPETIRVLGEFLTDERGRVKMVPGVYDYFARYDGWFQKPNSVWAAQTLYAMPLKNKPHGPKPLFDDVDPPKEWINWYQQIKEGRRTFSFEGDPTEYDLNGPVREARNPDLPRVERRPSVSSGIATDTDASFNIHPERWITALMVTTLAAVSWILLKRRKAV